MKPNRPNYGGLADGICAMIREERATVDEVLRDAARFLDDLPDDLGRGSLNGWKVQLRHKIGEMLTPTEMYRYFLSAKLGSEKVEREVTKEEFCKAERQAGFRPKMSSDDPRYMTTLATGGFSGGGISGRMKFEPDKEDEPCEGCGIRGCGGECMGDGLMGG